MALEKKKINDEEVPVKFVESTSVPSAGDTDLEGAIVFVKEGDTGKIYKDGIPYGGGGGGGDETERFGEDITSNKSVLLPKDFDMSGKSALDIIKAMFLAVYCPKYTTASITFEQTFVGNSGYYVLGTTATFTETIKVVPTPAKAQTTKNGEAVTSTHPADYEAEGGAFIDIKLRSTTGTWDSLSPMLGQTAVTTEARAHSISVEEVKQYTSATKFQFQDARFAAGASDSIVKKSDGTPTKMVSTSAFNDETGSSSGDINTNGTIASITPALPTIGSATVKGYMPLKYNNQITDVSVVTSKPSSTAPGGNSNTATQITMKDGELTNVSSVTAANCYSLLTGANAYVKMTMPKATSAVAWEVLVPSGYELKNFYIRNVGGNWESTTGKMLTETSDTFTDGGVTYKVWRGNLGDASQSIAFQFKKKS